MYTVAQGRFYDVHYDNVDNREILGFVLEKHLSPIWNQLPLRIKYFATRALNSIDSPPDL